MNQASSSLVSRELLGHVLLLGLDRVAKRNAFDLDLLNALQAIELDQGRERHERWGPRTLDLDILLFGDRLIDEPRLKVPHYHMHARPFVLYPLAEVAPASLKLADGRSLSQLLADCPFIGLERITA